MNTVPYISILLPKISKISQPKNSKIENTKIFKLGIISTF